MAGQSKGNNQEELYPIRDVVELTGVHPVTLRAWERRHGLIQPVRTEGGHRMYSSSDIEDIRRILAWTERGVSVSKVSKLLEQRAASEADTTKAADRPQDDEWHEWAAGLRQAVSRFDSARLAQLYGQAFSTYSVSAVVQEIFMPIWHELRDDRRFGRASQWTFLDAFLRSRIWQRLQLSDGMGEHRVLFAGIPDQCHELELLAAGLLLSGDEFSVNVLGPSQPQDEIAYVCHTLRPAALVLYAATPLSAALLRDLTKMAGLLECPVALTGMGSELAEAELRGTPIGCVGSSARVMQRRLAGILSGASDT